MCWAVPEGKQYTGQCNSPCGTEVRTDDIQEVLTFLKDHDTSQGGTHKAKGTSITEEVSDDD